MKRTPAGVRTPGVALLACVLLACVQLAGGCAAQHSGKPDPAGGRPVAARPPSDASGPGWTLVALGDSIPYAAPADCGGCTGYPVLLARRIEQDTGVPVRVRNDARHDSLDSAGLLDALRTDADMRSDVAAADIVTITIGHNDTPWVRSDDSCDGAASDQHANWARYGRRCVTALATALAHNLDRILAQVTALRHGRPTAIRVTNFSNDNERDPLAEPGGDAVSKSVVDAFSAAICSTARAHHLPCADVYHAFNGPTGTRFDGPHVAADHVHPNQRGHELIAKLLAGLGYGPLRPPSAGPVELPDHTGRIAFGRVDATLGDFSIWTARPDGSQQRRLTTTPSFFSDWSPDGHRIAYDYFDPTGAEQIATVSPDTGGTRHLTSGPGIQEAPKWSPDGQWIAFDRSLQLPDDPGFSTAIWVMRADGSQKRRITFGGFDIEPVFSPDGRQIAFGRITGVNGDGVQQEGLYVMDRDGSHLREIAPATLGVAHPDWSPDGRWIAFTSEPGGPESVYEVHPDATALHSLRPATARFQFYKPIWSPSGRALLVGCNDLVSHVDKLCVMAPDGSGVHVIVDSSPYDVNFPSWGK